MGATQQKGFTLTEMTVSVAVLSVLAAISIPGYNMYIARQQAAESVVLMDTVKSKTLQNIIKLGKCTESGLNETVAGKYGNLVVSGTASKSAMIDNQILQKTGCIFTYTLKPDTSSVLSGKTIIADLFNNGSLSKASQSTVDNLYIPKSLIGLVEGTKSPLNGDTPVTTPITPVDQLVPETNPTDPTNPTNPTNPTDPTNPTNPTDPTNPTNPTDPTTPTNPTNPTTPTDPGNGSNEITDEEQIAIAKTFKYKATFDALRPAWRGISSAMGVYIPKDQHPDFYNRNNWQVTGGTYSSDDRNTHWFDNKFVGNVYQIAWAGRSDSHEVIVGYDCAEGGGCGNIYKYYAEIRFYYKGVLVAVAKSGLLTSDEYSG